MGYRPRNDNAQYVIKSIASVIAMVFSEAISRFHNGELIVDELKKLGYDIIWIAEENPSLDDISIFKIAQKENRILLTNDKDFGDIVFRQKLVSSGIILFRIKGQDTREKIKLLTKVLVSHKDRISKHFVVITKEKFRFTPI